MWLLQKYEDDILNELCVSEDIQKLKEYALSETYDMDLEWSSSMSTRYYSNSSDNISFYITEILSI